MKQSLILGILALLLIVQPFPFSERVVSAEEGWIEVPFTSSTYVGYWYNANSPNSFYFESRMTNGEQSIEHVPRDRFYQADFHVFDASYLPIPDHITDASLIDFELVSKPDHVRDPRNALLPPDDRGNIYQGLTIINNYRGTGERRLLVPIVSFPSIAQDTGAVRQIGERSYRYDTVVEFVVRFPPPPEIPPDPNVPANQCVSPNQSATGISGTYTYRCNCRTDSDGNRRCSTCTGYYYETLSVVGVSGPEPSIVKAGQGTEIKITTRYTNQNPAHQGRNYGPSNMQINGIDSEEYPYMHVKTLDMVPDVGNPGYHWGSGQTVEWSIPYAMIEENGTWHTTRSLSEAQSFVNAHPLNFGGLPRWYTGFEVPDGIVFDFSLEGRAGYRNSLQVCVDRSIEINGTPYDEFIIRTVDPSNPFPTGTGLNWQGHEDKITQLEDWYYEPQRSYADHKEEVEERAPGLFQRIWRIIFPRSGGS
ncbi:hypothetical protein M3202_21255 [Alkalihalobacillus oceani]|uniref:Uncharacterized protein n=1 Tax=Halalkalibacter oceani TaxID=1653776 RepID=A0A9X2DW89_9BACI|nr:hypothetical protein [Halalkalibacter oceani]MCM3716575.1 hypothetical protein [Halalkalibacter oceani]